MASVIPENGITRRDFELCPALVRELRQMNDLIEYHLSAMTRCTQVIEPSGIRGGGSDDRIVDSIEQMTRLVDLWLDRAGKIAAHLRIVENVIATIPDSRQRHILRSHYFSAMSWKEIGAELGVSERRCIQIHDYAIKFLKM